MKLLVVDWDYFFPSLWGSGHKTESLYDWSCKEAPFFINDVWLPRAQGFVVNDLPLPGLSGEEKNFWDRVTFNPGARLYYGDSNARAVTAEIAEGVDEVLLLDAHHDSGYSGPLNFKALKKMAQVGRWSCDNWMIFYACVGAALEVRYPRWKHWAMELEDSVGIGDFVRRGFDEGGPIEGVDKVYVCRSGAWVPPWLDTDFIHFVNVPPVALRVGLEDGPMIREFTSMEDLKIQAVFLKAMRNGTVAEAIAAMGMSLEDGLSRSMPSESNV